MKICTRCKETKPYVEYHLDSTRKDGYCNWCKQCKRMNYSIINAMITSSKTRARKKNLNHNIDVNYLFYLKEKQNNKCALTGVTLNWEIVQSDRKRTMPPDRASLDRINAREGYIKDNVQLVCAFANSLKLNYDLNDFITFCKQVASLN